MVTYEYVSAGSPVVMYEKVNGFTINEYTAFIDRQGYKWTLYPRRRVGVNQSVTFTKKTVSVRNVTILPQKPLVTINKSQATGKGSLDEQIHFLNTIYI